MRPVEFFLLAIWAALMHLSSYGVPAVVLSVLSYASLLLALVASFRTFQREQAARAMEGSSS